MPLLISLLKATFEGAWRRWFGGGASDYFESKGLNEDSTWYTKLLCSRGTQTFVNYLFLTACFYYSFNIANTALVFLPESWQAFIIKYQLVLSVYNAIMFQSLYWSKGHGPMFDYGHQNPVTEETIRRHNEMWFTKYLNKWFDKKYGKENRYNYLYDSLAMLIRYTYPCVIVSLTAGWYILPLGLYCTCVYAFMWGIYDAFTPFFFNKKEWFAAPTKIAEVIIGAIVGFII